MHRLTCPHTPHQNGTVERKHRQIVEMGLTLLSHASLPLKFWDHSFTQVVHLISRLSTATLKTHSSPFHALFGSIPDYSTLRVFGCACFPFLRPTINTNSNLDLQSVFILVCPHSIKGTIALLLVDVSTYLRMSCSMSQCIPILNSFPHHSLPKHPLPPSLLLFLSQPIHLCLPLL